MESFLKFFKKGGGVGIQRRTRNADKEKLAGG